MKSIRTLIVLLPALLFATGCGSGSGKGTSGVVPPGTIPIDGQVSKGPVVGAEVRLYRRAASGLADFSAGSVAGPFITDASGAWAGDIPAGAPRPLVIVSNGGNYIDEASGESVAAGMLNGLLREGQSTAAVTPLTDLVVRIAAAQRAAGASSEDSIAFAVSTVPRIFNFGFDPLQTLPATPGSDDVFTEDQRSYANLLGGLAVLANTLDSEADAFDLVSGIIEDLCDGQPDRQCRGVAVTVGEGGGPLPPFSAADLSQAINQFATSPQGFEQPPMFAVSTEVSVGGSVDPAFVLVNSGATAMLTAEAADGFRLFEFMGCGGTFDVPDTSPTTGALTTDPVIADCTVTVNFRELAVWNEFEWNGADWQ